MPTLGNTVKPTSAQEWFGLNSKNQHAQALTLPPGGPWRITQVGGWFAGKSASPATYLCLWDATGVLLRAGGPVYPANYAFALGNSEQYQADITALDVAGGTQVFVGWSRDPAGGLQFGTYAGGGSHLDNDYAADPYPANLGSSYHGTGEISAALFYEAANSAPTAPTGLSPAGGGVIHTGRTITYAWKHNDPDGNPVAGYHWELYTYPEGGFIEDVWGGAAAGLTRTLPAGWNADRMYQFRVQTSDGSLWSPFSAFAGFRPNTKPNTVGVNAPATNTLTPSLSGGFSDPDPGATLSAIQLEVYRWNGSAWVLHWTSAETAASGTTWAYTYNGPALAYGTAYAATVRIRDQWNAWSSFGAWQVWTPVDPTPPPPPATPVAPTLSPNTVAVKQNSTTPALTISHGSAFTDHEIEINLPNGPLVQSISPAPYTAAISKISVPTALTPGQKYHYRARVLIGGVWSLWSSYAAFKINANPTAPTVALAADPVSGNQTVTTGAGVLVTTNSTPRWTAPFADPDKVPYGDAPSAMSIEIRRKDTLAALAGYPVTTGTAETNLFATALTADVEYEIRVGYRDNAGWPAGSYAYSAWKTVKYSAVPVVGLTAPAGGSSVTDSTPLLDWTYAGSAAKAQQKYRIRIYDLGASYSPVTITGSSVANPSVITTSASHGLLTGDRVTIAGHAGSTPDINGVHVVTVISATTFSIPVNVTVAGTGGTVDGTPNEAQVHDSTERIGADTAYDVPFGVLLNSHDYRWTVEAWDTDGLSTVLA